MGERSLDSKDFRILLELDRNARSSFQSISRSTAIPLETVRYRFEQLVRTGVIQNLITVVDGGRLGYYYYKVFLRLRNVNERSVRTIVSTLTKNPRICWVVRVDGSFDVAFTPRVTSPVEQSDLMDELRGRFSSQISHWTLSVNIRMWFFSRDFWTRSKSRKKELGAYSADAERYRLDPLETGILEELSKNPRASGTEISKSLDSSVETVLVRIRRLEKAGVIVRSMVVPNNELIGQLNFYVLVYFNAVTAAREEEFRSYCAQQPNIVYMIKSLGAWDYELNVEVFDIQDYRTLMLSLTDKFSDIIAEYVGMPVSEIAKYVYP